jgi:hypothetical protein
MKTMDDFIRQNAGMFENDEPLTGHEDRFRNRLDMAGRKKIHSPVWFLIRIAAILIVAVVLSYFTIREYHIVTSKINEAAIEKLNPELNEAERFYTSQLNIYYHKIESLGFNNDKAEKERVLKELTAMDEQVRVMKNDLVQNPDDERVMSAIINFYQVKIELMDMIITRAQKSNNKIL